MGEDTTNLLYSFANVPLSRFIDKDCSHYLLNYISTHHKKALSTHTQGYSTFFSFRLDIGPSLDKTLGVFNIHRQAAVLAK